MLLMFSVTAVVGSTIVSVRVPVFIVVTVAVRVRVRVRVLTAVVAVLAAVVVVAVMADLDRMKVSEVYESPGIGAAVAGTTDNLFSSRRRSG